MGGISDGARQLRNKDVRAVVKYLPTTAVTDAWALHNDLRYIDLGWRRQYVD